VIAFTEKSKKASNVEVEENEKDKETFIGIGAVPYQGYRDYVKRNRNGFFFSKEAAGKIGNEDCLNCEVDVHKAEPKLHLYCSVFRRPTFELAVEFEVLEDRKDQSERACRDTLDSVRFTAGADAKSPSTGPTPKSSGRLWT